MHQVRELPPRTKNLRDIHVFFVGGMIALYLLVTFIFPSIMPERLSFDTQRLYDMLDGTLEAKADGSYYGTVFLLKFIPDFLLMPLIATLGVISILSLTWASYSNKLRLVSVIMLVPLLSMCLARPQKEIFVVMIALAVIAAALWARNRLMFFVLTLGLYLGYAAIVRSYFALIVLTFLGLLVWVQLKPMLKVSALLLLLALLLCVPNDIGEMLIGPRDMINVLRDPLAPGNRTLFFNPFDVYGSYGFIGNYLYAMVRLTVPIIFTFGMSELFLMASLAIYAKLVHVQTVMQVPNWRSKYLALLFVAHFFVLILFEPDLGSFLRHLSSVCVYLAPGLAMLGMQQGGKVPAFVRRLVVSDNK